MIERVVCHDTFSHLQYAVAVDAFSDNESDDRRKWRLDAKIRIMKLMDEWVAKERDNRVDDDRNTDHDIALRPIVVLFLIFQKISSSEVVQ